MTNVSVVALVSNEAVIVLKYCISHNVFYGTEYDILAHCTFHKNNAL